MLPDVGRMTVPARPADENEFVDRVKILLGNRLRSFVPTERHEAEFRQFQAWTRAFGYRELSAHGAVVAGYLMAIMSEIGCLNKVHEARRRPPQNPSLPSRGLPL